MFFEVIASYLEASDLLITITNFFVHIDQKENDYPAKTSIFSKKKNSLGILLKALIPFHLKCKLINLHSRHRLRPSVVACDVYPRRLESRGTYLYLPASPSPSLDFPSGVSADKSTYI